MKATTDKCSILRGGNLMINILSPGLRCLKFKISNALKQRYCVMNKDTLRAIETMIEPKDIRYTSTSEGVLIEIWGMKVAICEGLAFGDVDIR